MIQTAAGNGSGMKAMVKVRRWGRGNWKTENIRNSAGCSGHKPCGWGSTPQGVNIDECACKGEDSCLAVGRRGGWEGRGSRLRGRLNKVALQEQGQGQGRLLGMNEVALQEQGQGRLLGMEMAAPQEQGQGIVTGIKNAAPEKQWQGLQGCLLGQD